MTLSHRTTIHSLSFHSRCKAENVYARKNKTHRQLTYEVTVKPTTNNSINNKHLLSRLQANVQYIPLGGTLRLLCDSHSSDPDAKIMWTLWRTENGRKVVTPNNFVLENSNRSLIVGNLTNAHYGNYTCQNEYGEQVGSFLESFICYYMGGRVFECTLKGGRAVLSFICLGFLQLR